MLSTRFRAAAAAELLGCQLWTALELCLACSHHGLSAMERCVLATLCRVAAAPAKAHCLRSKAGDRLSSLHLRVLMLWQQLGFASEGQPGCILCTVDCLESWQALYSCGHTICLPQPLSGSPTTLAPMSYQVCSRRSTLRHVKQIPP